MAKKKLTIKELTEHLQRLQAEFDNYRKRTETERETLRQTLNEHIIKELLPVVDNFQLAINHAEEDSELLQGVKLVKDQLTGIMENHGVSEISENNKFNPELHEAVETTEDSTKKNNTITKTLQPGYKLGEKILRPAKVSVVKNR